MKGEGGTWPFDYQLDDLAVGGGNVGWSWMFPRSNDAPFPRVTVSDHPKSPPAIRIKYVPAVTLLILKYPVLSVVVV